MRRATGVLVLVLASALFVVPDPVESQTAITLSLIGSRLVGGTPQEYTVTSIGEDDGTLIASMRASRPTAASSPVTVTVTVGRGTRASRGTVCKISGFLQISDCGGDYGVHTGGLGTTNGGLNDNTFDITIKGGQRSADGVVYIVPTPDNRTENNERIRFEGSASGYTVNNMHLTINDADRTILFTGSTANISEPCDGFPGTFDSGGIRADLGSGTNRANFVNSTGSTYLTNLNLNVIAVDGTAVVGTDFRFTNTYGNYISLVSGNIWSTTLRYASGPFAGRMGQVSLIGPSLCDSETPVDDTVAEDPKTLQLTFSAPSGFTVIPQEYVIHDDEDDDISLSVDTSTLAEGASGSGVTVRAGFPSTTTSSTIGSATVVTLSVEGEASPSAGEAGTGDLSYAPSSPNTITFPARNHRASGTATLSGLTVENDSVVEGPETFTVAGSSRLGVAEGAEVTIVDDDSDVTLSVSTEVVEEGSSEDVVVTAEFAGTSSVLADAVEVKVTLAGAAMGGASSNDFSVADTRGEVIANNEPESTDGVWGLVS